MCVCVGGRGVHGVLSVSGPQRDKHLPQSPFTCNFFRWRHLACLLWVLSFFAFRWEMQHTRKPLMNKVRCKQDYYLYGLRLRIPHELPANKRKERTEQSPNLWTFKKPSNLFLAGRPAMQVHRLAESILCNRFLGSLKNSGSVWEIMPTTNLKVHKNENFFGFDFEICTFS